MQKPLQVTKIRISNFMGISDLEISPVSKFNKIIGKNGSGKTSVVNAIQKTISEGKKGDVEFIMGGKDKAELFIELDGHIQIEKRISQSGSSLNITDNGAQISKPASYLSQLVGRYIVNPIQMFAAKPSEVREIFLSAIKLTLDEKKLLATAKKVPGLIDISRLRYDRHALEVIEELGEQVYQIRHQVNQDLTSLQKSIAVDSERLPKDFKADQFKDFNLNRATGIIAEARSAIVHHESEQKALEILGQRYNGVVKQVEDIDAEIQRLQHKREELDTERQSVYADGKSLKLKFESFKPADVSTLEAQIQAYETHQDSISTQKGIESNKLKLSTVQIIHAELDGFYKLVTVELPKTLLAEADLPLEGLEFSNDEIRVNGVALHLVNEAERLKLSVRLAKALNSGIGLMLIDGWECLDPDNQDAFISECGEDDGFKYIVTAVGRGPLSVEQRDSIAEPAQAQSKTSTAKKATSKSPF